MGKINIFLKHKKSLDKAKKLLFLQPQTEKTFLKSIRGVVQLASMLAWGASGRRFESCHSDNTKG
jgi:hypothetical protein